MAVRTFLRAALAVGSAIALSMVLYLFACVQVVQSYASGSYQSAGSVDAVVVMGAAQYDGRPSPMLEERLKSALVVWQAGGTKWIAVTGGRQEGDRFTEAGASAKWLVEKGVPESAIIYEETGHSTWESLEALNPVLVANNVRTVLMITTDWHVARATLTMRELGYRVESQPAGGEGRTSWGSRVWREAAGIGAGRILGFGRLFRITG